VKYAATFYFAVFFALSAPFYLACLMGLWLLSWPFDRDRHAVHALVSRMGISYFRINPMWRLSFEGRDLIPKGPAVFVANHQSMADVIAILGLNRRFKFVSKSSLFEVPVVGWAMRLARYVSLRRGLPHTTQAMLESCRHWLRRGTAVLIFPEGTYAPVGKLLPFKRGAFRLAIERQVPLVPVVIEGTRTLVIEDGPWLEPRCRIRIRVQPPLLPSELGTDENVLADRVRELFARELGIHA
jgi:1-acyl-sn-glycerol-3-phosphate acyltransferase